MRYLIPFLILLAMANAAVAADELSFTQRAQFEQKHYNEVQAGRKKARNTWNKTIANLPPATFDGRGKLRRDDPAVIRATEVYNKKMAEVGRQAKANYDAEIGAVIANSNSGVGALRAEKARLQVEAFKKYEAMLPRRADGTTNKRSPEYKKLKAELDKEWTRIDSDMNAKDARRRQMIKNNFNTTGGDGSYKVVGDLPEHLKSDADMTISDPKKFKKKIAALTNSNQQTGWTSYSDRNVDHLNDLTAWKDTSEGSKGKRTGSSSNDAEIAFGAQQGSDSFPSTDGKRYAAGARKYNKLNAFNSNLVKLTHSVGDTRIGSVSYQDPKDVDFKTFAKSTVKGAGIAGVGVDKTLGEQLTKLQKGKIIEESLDLFGDSPAQKDAKVKEFLQRSTKVARKSYKKVKNANTEELKKLTKNVEILKRNNVAPERIARAEKLLLKNKSLAIENRGIYGELVTINPELVGSVISDEGKIVRKTNGEFVDTRNGRLLSSSEVRERYLVDVNADAIDASSFVGSGKESLFSKSKSQLNAIRSSKTFKAVSGSYNVIELGVSAVKGAQRAVGEEKDGDSDLKTFSKALYYASPVAGINDLTKASVFTGLTNYQNELALSNSPNDTTTQALLLGKHATIEFFGAAGTLAKESLIGFIDTGKSLGSFAEWSTRSTTEENSFDNKDSMERKLISYRAKYLKGLYAKAKALRSDDIEGLNTLNGAVAATIKQWKSKTNAHDVLARAKKLQSILLEAVPAPAPAPEVTKPRIVENNAADPVDLKPTPDTETNPFGGDAPSGEDNPFGDISKELFADVDQNEVYRLKQQQAESKNRILQSQRSNIYSKVSEINQAHIRRSAAISAAAQSMQQSLVTAQIQLNNTRAQERVQDLQNQQIINQNRENIAAMTRNNNNSPYTQSSTNGYPVTDPYAQRFQEQQAQVRVSQQQQFVEPSQSVSRHQPNEGFSPSPFEEPPAYQAEEKQERLWAIIAYLHPAGQRGDNYTNASCYVISSDLRPLDKVGYYKPSGREGVTQFYMGYTYARPVADKEYCQQRINGKNHRDLFKLHTSRTEHGYGFPGPHTKEDLILMH